MTFEPAHDKQDGSAGASPSLPEPLAKRAHPAHGVHRSINRPTVIFLTVCTKDRRPYLANQQIHDLLVEVWKSAEAWLVGRYVVMPDHLHLFASPGGSHIPFDNWVRYWKSQFTKRCPLPGHRWQPDHWDRTLRDGESYEEKWNYVRDNPLRQGLVARAAEWPFQGELNALRW